MPFFDLSFQELNAYTPARREPDDFDAFWRTTLAEAREFPLDPVFAPVDFGLNLIETYDVAFSGYGGQRVKGWYMQPAGARDLLPCVVEYIGYGGGRGFPINWLVWPVAGYATLIMDTRGQGSVWLNGDTPDVPDGANPSVPGFMTQGILDPHSYYYRRVFTDGVRAVEAARAHPQVDPARIVLTGSSQGGGIAVAVSGLVPDVAAALPDVPFLCHFRRAIGLTEKNPYREIVTFLSIHRERAETVFGTLDYFDGMNLGARAKAPALFSTALMDMTCPPSTVFAAYNHYAGPKDIRVYDYNEHEGGGSLHTLAKLRFLADLWH